MMRTQIQLTEEQDRRLEALAATNDVSKAELVREAVDLLLRERANAATRQQRRERALTVIGAFAGDGANVSTEHDAHLAWVK
jgi:Arc/MetJ-type ribon-helix-helix transcriptional regulator